MFSAYVYDDEDLNTVQLQDEEWKTSKITARAYDSLYVRHWDHYIGPKHSSLFTVKLAKESGAWTLSENIHAPLNGTRHVSSVTVLESTKMTKPRPRLFLWNLLADPRILM